MTEINLLPWREELRIKKRKKFLAILVASGLSGLFAVVVVWSVLAYQLEDQEQANQLISSSNQHLEDKLSKIKGLEVQRNAVIERISLIQAVQGLRPVSVRLLDEFVRVTPANMYLVRISRVANQITIEGRADHPDTVAILLRRLKSSPWFKNAVMTSFEAKQLEASPKDTGGLAMRPESDYGDFVLSVDVAELSLLTLKGPLKEPINPTPVVVGAS